MKRRRKWTKARRAKSTATMAVKRAEITHLADEVAEMHIYCRFSDGSFHEMKPTVMKIYVPATK